MYYNGPEHRVLLAHFIFTTMLTVYSQVKKYCEIESIPLANRFDMENIGRMVATHFRRFWGISQPAEVISQAGFVLSEEAGKPMLVVAYPECFAEEMKARITLFYETKRAALIESAQKQPIQPEKVTKLVPTKERKRTPVKRGPEKIMSVKPENPNL